MQAAKELRNRLAPALISELLTPLKSFCNAQLQDDATLIAIGTHA